MKGPTAQGTPGFIKRTRREMVEWLIILAYLGVLVLLTKLLWHLFWTPLFLTVFVALGVAVILAFRSIERGRAGKG